MASASRHVRLRRARPTSGCRERRAPRFSTRSPGRDDVRITFDDGNISDYVHGLPALMERGLNATFFVVGGRIGAPGFLHAEAVRALLDAGMQIGSHGMEHRRWRGPSERELRSELEHSKAAL